MARRRLGLGIAAAVLGAGALLGVQLAGYGFAGREPPPGVSAGVSALDHLPPAATVPASVVRFVDAVAPQRDTDPHTALAEIRKVRSDLGRAHADLYAFRSSAGAPCFILVGQVGTCARSARDGSPGLHWTIGGGSSSLPSNLVGIASDDVRAVELEVDGASVPVSLVNNAVFAEYPAAARNAVITIDREDGSHTTVQVQLEPSTTGAQDLRTFRLLRREQQTQP
jgi:hypothetical protein